MKRVVCLGALALSVIAVSAHADAPVRVSFETTTPLPMAAGDTLLVTGVLSSSASGEEVAPEAVFDLEAGGLASEPRAELDSLPGVARIRSSGSAGPACAAAGVASPCLVPRVSELAHQRFMTTADFRRTLSGSWTLEIVHATPGVIVAPERESFAAPAMALSGVAAVAAALFGGLRRRKRTAIGHVYAAALAARKATRHDPTLAVVRTQIDELVARAELLEDARLESRTRLTAIDRAALERKREAWSRSSSPDAPEAVEWVTAELAEAARLESDLASSIVGIDRVAAALRLVALRSRAHRGTRARSPKGDPVDALVSELDRRDSALHEVSRV